MPKVNTGRCELTQHEGTLTYRPKTATEVATSKKYARAEHTALSWALTLPNDDPNVQSHFLLEGASICVLGTIRALGAASMHSLREAAYPGKNTGGDLARTVRHLFAVGIIGYSDIPQEGSYHLLPLGKEILETISTVESRVFPGPPPVLHPATFPIYGNVATFPDGKIIVEFKLEIEKPT